MAAQHVRVEHTQIMAANPDGARLRVEQPEKQPRDRGFTRAARADNADLLAGGDGKRKLVMRGRRSAGISEVDIGEIDGRAGHQELAPVDPASDPDRDSAGA